VLAKYEHAYAEIGGRGPILSENASLGYWNDILDSLTSVYNEYGESLRGVVILHGTDTMSYMAPLLLFRAQGLTFPIVITGANLQPSLSPDDTSKIDMATDAWGNIHAALVFIDRYGGVVPGVYVSFASRICLPFNLRKLRRQAARDRVVGEIDAGAFVHQVIEPTHLYRFENVNTAAPYLARIVDGEIVLSDIFRHVQSIYKKFQRGEGVRFNKIRVTERSCFLLKITPALFPLFTDSGWQASGGSAGYDLPNELSIVIFEGYKSGTLPTSFENSIQKFCLSCRDRGIPVVLTTRYGLHESEYGSTKDLTFLIRPKMMISETMLAAAYHVVDEVEAELSREGEPDLDIASQRRLLDRRSHGIERRLMMIEELFESIKLRPD